ncbi:carbohydrate kinase family protein [Sandarakinorhabdus sp.]|uniref:carbohydrate kinase family protein n=1 Tax=Sandarakinorhabdus sp. TaxID=1916663 RepID=UPI003F70D6D4
MARILVAGSLGWDVPLWLDRPLSSGARIGARTLAMPAGGAPAGGAILPGRLGGGAANIASALVCAGHEVLVVGRVGQDALGQYVFYALHKRGLSLDGIRVDAAPTVSLQILIEPSGERTILGIGPARNTGAGGGQIWQRWSMAASLVQRFAPDALILRGSQPSVPPLGGLLEGRLVVAHMPWWGDPPERVDVAVGSHKDLGDQALAQPLQAAEAVFGPVEWGVVTAGDGDVQAQSATDQLAVPAVPASVVDATGAGDIFIAGLTDALLAGAGMGDALAHGCRWGAAAVAMEGSAPEPGAEGFFPFDR